MDFKEIPTLRKWFLKYTNKPAYRAYKESRRDYLELQNLVRHEKQEEEKFVATAAGLQHLLLQPGERPVTSFKHSGNSGDIIYSLPAAFALAGSGKVRLYLHAHQPIDNKNLYHPLGNVMLNERVIEMLKPLLLHQPLVESVETFAGQPIDADLDTFRRYAFPLDRGSITRWYFWVFGVTYNTALPWLTAPQDEAYKNTIVIARSHRYRSPVVDYSFLQQYPNKLFLGLEDEYRDMKKAIPDLEHKPVKDFLEMATVIRSCRLFIGNQSFPFSLAEAMKVPRLLEVHYKAPNVIVEGEGANDFIFQPQFENTVKRLFEKA